MQRCAFDVEYNYRIFGRKLILIIDGIWKKKNENLEYKELQKIV